MKKITVWRSLDKSLQNPKMNHIENDWVKGDYPKPIKFEFSNQEAWKNMKWIKQFSYLNEENIIVDKK